MTRILACLFTAVLALPGRAQTGSLTLIGEDGRSRTMSATELASLEQHTVTIAESNGDSVTFRGPTLRSLVTLVGAPTGRALRGPAMLVAILAEARDGYKVAYMLAEIDDQFGSRTAIVALTQDGRAMSENDGPLRMVLPDEEHRARWIRQLTTLRLVRVSGPGGH